MNRVYFLPFLNWTTLTLALLWSCSVFALKESEISKVYKLLENQSFYHIKSFKGTNTVKHTSRAKQNTITLRYAKFGKGKGEKGSLMFINGWAENLLKYTELFYDLHLKGFSPIYTYDHRGQGFSDRLLPNPHIGYVEDYSFYRKDMKAFIEIVLKDPEINKDNLFLIAHSMGGAIALDYLQTYLDQKHFKAMVLSAPLLKIQIGYPVFDPFILSFVKLACWFFCKKQVPGINTRYMERKLMSGSQARIKFGIHIETKFPKAILDRPSYHWVLKSFSATKDLMQEKKILRIHIPLLILQAKKEVLVSNKYQNQFCGKLQNYCHIKRLAGRHELFLETDTIRDKAIEETIRFFSML